MLNLLSTVQSTTPDTIAWSPSVAMVMIACNVFAIAIGRFAIQNYGGGPELPFPKPSILEGFGVPELLATASFGHVIGAGVILGLANAGVI